MKKLIVCILAITSATTSLVGCKNETLTNEQAPKLATNLDFDFKVDPDTFQLTIDSKGKSEMASQPLEKMKVSKFKKSSTQASWRYDEKNLEVELEKKENYLDVSIKSNIKEENQFSWPKVEGNSYMLPLNEGKMIPSDDEIWKEYLDEQELKTIESFSMPFFAVNKEDYALVYIMKNPYNNTILFDTKEDIKFSFNHEYPSISEQKEYGFRIYVTDNNPVDIAKTYKDYVTQNKKFKTLEEKEKENPNIEKLYGAPHVYFWDKTVISEENIKWSKLRGNFPEALKLWLQDLLINKVEDGKELAAAFDDINNLEYVDKYTKNRIIKGLSSVIGLKEFYNPKVFTSLDQETNELIKKGTQGVNQLELIELNKRLLKGALNDFTDPVENWADANTVDILSDMKSSGLDKMWIGLDDWQGGFIKPDFINKANELGYLIGTYDSYHSIHKPGEEKWITAKFEDNALFEEATIMNKKGEKIEGFQGVGRKLNPTLAMPSVKERVSGILSTGLTFNSWFLDTDATGEVFDDYSPNHITTEEEDIVARIERMDYLQKEYNMVVGSEGGNDFASQSIAFAHGIETPSFSWMDPDMNKNKESEYYVGRYYSSHNGVPEMFSKQIPLKEYYKKLFIDPTYTVPLYKLVYNDSVITTHWWGWGTLKIQDEIENRMLYEVLYNVPPLYHIDKEEWGKHKETIINHSKVWSEFSQKAINKEMTNYKILTEDRLVQMTQYGKDLKVIANFSKSPVTIEGENLEASSLLIIDGDTKMKYKPEIVPQ